MKRKTACLLLILLAVLAVSAHADSAKDIGSECKIWFPENGMNCAYLTDHDYVRGDNLNSRTEHVFYIQPGETPVAQMEVFFGTHILPYRVEKQQDGVWVTVAEKQELQAQSYLCFEPIAETFRVVFWSEERSSLTLKEILLYSQGDTAETELKPWNPPCEKAEIMLLVAHPDDELLWFGGLLPTYAGERKLPVQVVYMTCGTAERRQELLRGLWICGVRNYPLLCGLEDVRYSAVERAYQRWGKETTYQTIVRAIRQFQPEVLVTHDILGEYGHTQHIVTSDAAYQAVLLAADPTYDPESAAQYGTWQVKKMYRHLGNAPTLHMDWNQPLSAFGGQTGLAVAAQALQMHVSQLVDLPWTAPPGAGEEYDSTALTLVYTTVGPDEACNDLLEHIPQ
jgi:LmbE family N-acetylglucosaminyl deacetylase